jgi:hypothetical protein
MVGTGPSLTANRVAACTKRCCDSNTLGDGSSKVRDTVTGTAVEALRFLLAVRGLLLAAVLAARPGTLDQLIPSWAPADYFTPYTVSCILLVTSIDASPLYLKAATST